MDLPKRKPIRLRGYDYSQSGAYFVTIGVSNRDVCFWQNAGAAKVPKTGSILPQNRCATRYTRTFIKTRNDHRRGDQQHTKTLSAY